MHPLRLSLAALLLVVLVTGCATQQPTGRQRVVIDKTTQTLTAYQGGEVAFRTRVSTGKIGKGTPNGTFRAGGKELMHLSSLYENAPMPYSVHITGNYFIHGSKEVPNHPASHGCIRLPLGLFSPAKRFYYWVKPGTPIEIVGHWPG